jgi:hypothetical protein
MVNGEAGVVRVEDKGGGVETRVLKPGEVYEENDAEIVKRPDDQEVNDHGEEHDDARGQAHVDKVAAGGDSHDVAAGVDDHTHDDARGQVTVDKVTAGGDGHDNNTAEGADHVRARGGEGDAAAKHGLPVEGEVQEEVRVARVHVGGGVHVAHRGLVRLLDPRKSSMEDRSSP